MKLTAGQKALIAILNSGASPRAIDRRTVRRIGLAREFQTAMRAGLLQSAGYETSVKADDWLDSSVGRLALKDGEGK